MPSTMEPLPLPPPIDGPLTPPSRPERPGQLTLGWRTVFIVGWAGVVLGLGAVLKSSRTMGLSTWWLGPNADPNSIVLQLLPFVVPGAVIVLAFRNARFLPYIGLIGALLLGAISVGDLGRFDGLAQVELATAAVGLLISLAAFAGLLRPGPPAPAVPDPWVAVEPEAALAGPATGPSTGPLAGPSTGPLAGPTSDPQQV